MYIYIYISYIYHIYESTINTCHLRNNENIWNNRIVAFSIKQLLVGTQHLTAPNQSMSIRGRWDAFFNLARFAAKLTHDAIYIYIIIYNRNLFNNMCHDFSLLSFLNISLNKHKKKNKRVVGRSPPLVPSRPPAAPLRRRLTPADKSQRTMSMNITPSVGQAVCICLPCFNE